MRAKEQVERTEDASDKDGDFSFEDVVNVTSNCGPEETAYSGD